MASHISFVIYGLLSVFITIVVQSIPIEKPQQIVPSPSIDNKQVIIKNLLKSVDSAKILSISTADPATTVTQSSSSTTITQENNNNNNKKKRYINDDQLDGLLDSESNDVDSDQIFYSKINNNNDKTPHVLHPKMHETSATIHDNAARPVNTDDSNVFSDIKMFPSELANIVRRRRNIKLNDESNRRRKRAISPYDFYDTDSLYDPYVDLIEQDQYDRPTRSFAPLYWYPSAYERNIRSTFTPYIYESSEYPRLYSAIDNNDEINEDPLSPFNDENENENDYELNRYPILLPTSNNPFDNLQLQQQYNIDDLPIDEDIEQNFNDDDDNDDDEDEDEDEEKYSLFQQNERPYHSGYGPLETYF